MRYIMDGFTLIDDGTKIYMIGLYSTDDTVHVMYVDETTKFWPNIFGNM